MAEKKPLITTGEPAPETPLGKVYHSAKSLSGDDEITRESYRQHYRVPLVAYNLVKTTGAREITDINEFKDNIRTGILTGDSVIEDPYQLTTRTNQIFDTFKRNIIDTIPRFLIIHPYGEHLIINIYSQSYGHNATDIKFLFRFLKAIYDDIDKQWTSAKKVQGGIDNSEDLLPPEKKRERDVRAKYEASRAKLPDRGRQVPTEDEKKKIKELQDKQKKEEEHKKWSKESGLDDTNDSGGI